MAATAAARSCIGSGGSAILGTAEARFARGKAQWPGDGSQDSDEGGPPINPGLYSGATGHHFARPGNRFWPALWKAGFTERLLKPWEERELLGRRHGITNLVARTTATADELNREELIAGRKRLIQKVRRYRPEWLAVVGIGAYRIAFEQPKAQLGLRAERIDTTRIWLLPNPSGLNAHHQLTDLTREFARLRQQLDS